MHHMGCNCNPSMVPKCVAWKQLVNQGVSVTKGEFWFIPTWILFSQFLPSFDDSILLTTEFANQMIGQLAKKPTVNADYLGSAGKMLSDKNTQIYSCAV